MNSLSLVSSLGFRGYEFLDGLYIEGLESEKGHRLSQGKRCEGLGFRALYSEASGPVLSFSSTTRKDIRTMLQTQTHPQKPKQANSPKSSNTLKALTKAETLNPKPQHPQR